MANFEHLLYMKNTEIAKLKEEENRLKSEMKKAEIENEDLN